MGGTSYAQQTHREFLKLLQELCAVKNPSSNVRPFCDLLVKNPAFLPREILSSRSAGRELMHRSLLGPFFSLSLFAQDDTEVSDNNNNNSYCDIISNSIVNILI